MERKWRKVSDAEKWDPEDGEELVGIYLGTDVRKGKFGSYDSHKIKSDGKVYHVAGVILSRLLDKINPGTNIRIVYKGITKTGAGFDMKSFDLFVGDATTEDYGL